ncbi:restriction endonuclease subunit S [Nitrosospira briensis]|uniref:restriction endonuclease subunit S n=1 Tax=Nitrosospira briensis TaxID=35799 RepID=UPI0008DF48D4|nr:restriction endonuclease subunit S [Nitrosospira briensis]SFN92687.1 type I restriction enzyme, S subunit [Nitrosospira briensis]
MKAGWAIKPLGEVCDVINGGTPKTGVIEYWEGPHQWLTPAEMGKRSTPYVAKTERSITDAGLQNSSARLLPPQSVILSSRAPIGHLVINTSPMATNQGCKGLVPGNNLDAKYLYYYLAGIVPLLNELGTGATFKELSGGKLKEVPVPVAPLPEQHRIGAILDKVFDGIATVKANAEKNLQNARALFESYLQSVFTERGEGLEETTLGKVCQFVGGSQPPKSVFEKVQTPDNIRLIQIRDYKSDKHIVFIPRNIAKRFCDAKDVMIGRYGPPLFQILRGLEGAYNVALMKAVPDTSKLSRDYLFYFLKHSDILQYVIYHSERAAGQIGVTKETLEPFPIALPHREMQEKLVAAISEVESETQRLESLCQQKLAALGDLKKSLLHQAFTGEL